MRIHELARRTGVSIRSLRYYEQKQLITARRLNNHSTVLWSWTEYRSD
jgi:DNA-binding transcriptional MerR regulator